MSTLTIARQLGLEERNEGLSLTKNSLTRSLRTDTTRRIASSSSPDSVTVTSACMVPLHPTPDSPTFVLCSLSDGTLCIINTANLAKTYFFDEEPASDSAEPDAPKTDVDNASSHRFDTMAVTCVCTESSTAAARHVVSYVYVDNKVFCATLSVADAAELKKLHRGKWDKVTALPDTVHHTRPLVTFAVSPFSTKVLVLASTRTARGPAFGLPGRRSPQAHHDVVHAAILSPDTDGTTSEAVQWSQLTTSLAGQIDSAARVSVSAVCWLSEDTVLCLWSSGELTVWSTTKMELVACATLFAHCPSGGIRAASVAVSKKGGAAVIAVVVEETVLLTFTAQVNNGAGGQPTPKCPRVEENPGRCWPMTLTIAPTSQSFCSEDICITDVCVFYAFSWVVAVTLESGAVAFVDALTMDILCHKGLSRVTPVPHQRKLDGTATRAAQFTLVQEKPLLLASFDHNTVTFSKSH